ncbi:MAG TPA: LpxD N-terminal domain-containing protein, partial [Syntrophales bacterium]|nr:LpxD N-terminal domain-containing protein [Syntrophales bacterium]
MEKSVSEIAEILNGTVIGDGRLTIRDVKGIDEAGEGDLTFIANQKYRKHLEDTGASAVLVSPDVKQSKKTLIVVRDPYASMARVLSVFYPPDREVAGISPLAFVAKDAFVSEDA